ncbi:LuxR C-terminal-related transcriptional regulator [Camelimonas sp. ID_303_24]
MTSTPLLVSTKFAPPRLPLHPVAREALSALLGRVRHSRLTLVTGGAGFGKTTMLAQIRLELLRHDASVLWVSLSTDERSFPAFCASLTGGLQQAGLLPGDELPMPAEADGDDELRAVAATLINAFAHGDAEIFLLVDDFHHTGDPRIEQLVQLLVEGGPVNLHAIIASRTAPGLQLGRLRAMGHLCEIAAADLAFSFRESLAFLRSNLDPHIDLDMAHGIHAQTDGWPIGLQLTAIALKAGHRRRIGWSGAQPNSDDLNAYLTEDVLAGFPEGLMDFLQKLSILRRFNAELAAHVTGAANAADMLATIGGLNLFLQPVDLEGRHQWYRLHPMFIEYLNGKLGQSNVEVRALHRRAAEWFARENLVTEAFRHALPSEDFDLAINVMERTLRPTRNLNEVGLFTRWIEGLPVDVVSQRPKLAVLGAWAYALTARPDQATALIARMESGGASDRHRARIILANGMIAVQRDDQEACRAAIAPLMTGRLANAQLEHIRLGLVIGVLARQGHYAEARAEARNIMTRDNHEPSLIARNAAVMVELVQGNFLEAQRLTAPLLALAEGAHGPRSLSACMIAATMAEIAYEFDDTAGVGELLARRMDMLRFSVPACAIAAALCVARLQAIHDSPAIAASYLAARTEHFRARGLERGVALMVAEQLRLELDSEAWRQGDWRKAGVLLQELEELDRRHAGNRVLDREIRAIAALSRARLARARGEGDAALEALDAVDAVAGQLRRGQLAVTARVVRALALADLERDDEAAACLTAALGSGYELGLVRTFLDEGEPLRQLLASLPKPGDRALQAYRRQLLARRFAGAGEDAPLAGAGRAGGDRKSAAALTPREAQILDLLEQAMPNKRIAQALDISAQTVKWNLRNIFMKLGVSTRYEAILAVRERSKQGARPGSP